MTRKRTKPSNDERTVLDSAAALAPLRLERADDKSIVVSLRLSAEGEALKRQLDALLNLLLQRLELSLAALLAELLQRLASAAPARRRVLSLPAPAKPPVRLTRRELEIVALLAQRRSNDEIARALNIERSTLSTHLRHIRRKLGNRGQVLEWWEHNRERYPQL